MVSRGLKNVGMLAVCSSYRVVFGVATEFAFVESVGVL